MKNLYQTTKNYVAKSLIGLVLIAGVGTCDPNSSNQDTSRTTDRPAYLSTTIYRFGLITYRGTKWKFREERTSVALADMDGDRDLDIIVSNDFGEVVVLENRIPQNK